MPDIEINKDKCIKCGICVLCCPATLFTQTEKTALPEVLEQEYCISCGHCVAVCPHGAVIHSEYPYDSVVNINREILPSTEQIIELIRSRRSIRAFREKPVEKNLIEQIIDAARFAPTAHNSQSTRYLVIEDEKIRDEIVDLTAKFLVNMLRMFRNPFARTFLLRFSPSQQKEAKKIIPQLEALIDAVKTGDDFILHNAPALILFHARKNTIFSKVNANLAFQNASLVCQSLGLGGFYTGYVIAACERDRSIPKMLNIPDNHNIFAGLAIGYPMYDYSKWVERKPAEVKWI